jgi:uncharacterized protein (TIGR00661 family)
MKILYGVVGEGMGHAIRSSVTLDQLLAWGHEVQIVVSGRAADFLRARYEGVNQIWGLTMVMADNRVKKWRTAMEVLSGAVGGMPDNVRQYLDMTDRFKPDVVISDFETWSALYGHNNRIPVISVDNMQIIRRCGHPKEIKAGQEGAYRLARSVIKAKMPRASHYVITTFFDAPITKSRTTLVPPILRQAILDVEPSAGDHLLVYQTSETFTHLPDLLRKIDMPVRLYGLRRDLKERETDGNLTWCPFSEQGFISDLATCRGVIASAGFTLIGEALHFGKPYLATPVGGQFEQVLNARYIEHLGYGMNDERLDLDAVTAFTNNLDQYAETLASYPRRDNSELFDTLQALLDRVEAGF